MSQPALAMDFNAIRVALVRVIQSVTALPCIVEERKAQLSMATPRPPLPYCSFKIITQAGKIGTDSVQAVGTAKAPSTKWIFGGVRRMVVSFKCYARIPEEAANYMALLEASLDTDPIQETLRASKVAFWQSLGVIDISAQLTAGYEGRASLDVVFGTPSNLTVDLSSIDSVPVHGQFAFGSDSQAVDFTVTGAPKL